MTLMKHSRLRSRITNQSDPITLPYAMLIESHLEHLHREYDRVKTDEGTPPEFWFVTTTFLPFKSKRADYIPIKPRRCVELYEKFYVRLLSRLMNNFQRKRHLQPLTYVYIDFPFTKKKKSYATLSPTEQFKINPYRYSLDHPETTPHIHSVMLIPPKLVDRFKTLAPSLESLFENLAFANCTLDASPLKSSHDLRNVMFYSSKLLKQIPQELRDTDLYTVLPNAKSEPIYTKPEWERELEDANPLLAASR